MNVLIDVNVLLDVLLAREPWFAQARAVWESHDRGSITGYVAAHALTNLFYIARRTFGIEAARAAARLCLQTFEIVPVGRAELEDADRLPGTDLEDNMILACAVRANLDAIVTRDPGGFAGSPLPVFAPAEFLAHLSGPAASPPPTANP